MKLTGDFLVLLVAVSFSGVASAALARWYVWPWLAAKPRERALEIILWPHVSRFLNLAAATRSQVDRKVPTAWLREIAWGDCIAAALALLAINALRENWPSARKLVWLATLFGIADFLNSFGQGIYDKVSELPIGIVWQIAVGAVPPLFTCHVIAWKLLRQSSSSEDGAPASRRP